MRRTTPRSLNLFSASDDGERGWRRWLHFACGFALAALMLGDLPAEAATFGLLQGGLTIQAGAKDPKAAGATIGSASLTDTELVGSIDLATAGLTLVRIGGNYFAFSGTATSVTNQQAPAGQANADANVAFAQNFLTATPQWIEVSARVVDSPTDAEVTAFVKLDRGGTNIFTDGDSSGGYITRSGLYAAGNFTLTGSIDTSAVTIGSHSGTIDGTLIIASLADFNGNMVVDGADLATWKAGFGSVAGTFASGNLDGDMDTDGADFLLWQKQLGTHSLATPAASAVPEPATGLLVVTALSSASHCCRTRRSATRRASTSPAR